MLFHWEGYFSSQIENRMITLIIWHYKGCGTSNKVLDYLVSKEYHVQVRDYQKDPPSVKEIKEVLVKMGKSGECILRRSDKVYKERFENANLSEAEWLQAMELFPSIIQRPIVISSEKAWLARPAEDFQKEFDQWVLSQIN